MTGVEETLAGLVATPREEILACLRDDAMLGFLLGLTTEDAYLEEVIRKNSWPISLPDLKRAVRRNFDHAVPGMEELVRELATVHRLALISDQGREWAEYVEERHDFLRLLRPKFYSYVLHTRKTSPDIFRMALENLGCPAGRCLLVDDRARFISAAEQVGMRAVLFKDSVQLRRELADRRIL